jgi:hypothetical protein
MKEACVTFLQILPENRKAEARTQQISQASWFRGRDQNKTWQNKDTPRSERTFPPAPPSASAIALPIPREEPVTIDTGASTSLIGSDTAGSVVAKACALTPHHLPGLAELLEQGLSRRAGKRTTPCPEEGSRRGDSWSGVRVHAEEEEATTAVDAAVQVHNDVATAMPPSFPLLPPSPTRLSLVKRTPKRQSGKQKQPRKKLKRKKQTTKCKERAQGDKCGVHTDTL